MTLDLLRELVTKDFRNRSVLIKPNLAFPSYPGSGAITHCEVIRGVVRFLKEAGAKPFIGDGCIFGVNPQESFEATGAATVAKEEGIEIVNWDEGQPVE